MANPWGSSWGSPSVWGLSWDNEGAVPLPPPTEVGRGRPREVPPRRRRIRPEELPPFDVDGLFLQPWQTVRGTWELSDEFAGEFEQRYSGIAHGEFEVSTEYFGTITQEVGDLTAQIAGSVMRGESPKVIPIFAPLRIAGRLEQAPQEVDGTFVVE